MKLKVSTKPEALSNFSEGASFINKSGIYDVTIKFASVTVTATGAESVNFNIEYNGGSQTLYGPYVTNKDGETNEIGARVINGLAVIADMDEGAGFSIEKEEHAVGKDNKVQEFDVITDFTDLTCKVRVQEEYSINPKTSEIKDRLVIKEFYRADGASAAEVASGNDIGKQLAKVEEKYASNVTYKDNLTPEAVAEFKKARAAGKSAPAKPAPATAKPSASLFR